MSEQRSRPSVPPKDGSERRQWDRGPLVVSGEMIIRDEIYASLSQNISGGGMFLLLPGGVVLGDVVRLKFRVGGGREILATAEVVWAAQRRSMSGLRQLPVGVGLKFIELGDQDRNLILAYVRAVLATR